MKCLLATVFARAAVEHVVRLAVEDAVVPSALILVAVVWAWPAGLPLLQHLLHHRNRHRSNPDAFEATAAATAACIPTRLVASATAELPLPALLNFTRVLVSLGNVSFATLRAVYLDLRMLI